ncbi:MarR family transcriptional regulator [Caulobacter sp. D4A]|uniref:MarR family winged helix-turn-helix transcriptional regulator n=1 Tax=unclassified Caulobacter TaxID=2648921 RepID=UPI000D73EF49|nr:MULTISPECIES: MarR family winged helix-turn-helix transcriptional regulator [unclassified Caulobacter]PXA82757.1 MarR family transcriptional regulator [Caulobacter sp. D5]PXA92754.1 MarR family transcriptional regulator [Caulobacter sp. D4A]
MSTPPAPAPDKRLVFLLASGHRRVQRWIEAKLAADRHGLTSAQSGVLFYLGGADGALIGEAAEALDLAPSAMTGLVDRMTRAGLVERRPDPKDGRALRLHLTDHGRAAREEAKAGLAHLNAHLTEGFTDDEIAVVARWLASLQTKFPKGDVTP